MPLTDSSPEGDGKGPFRSGFVALIGRPNVGKSTLLNYLIGDKVAIVSDKPQTTRNRITGVLNRPGAQIAFVDTPGIHRPLYRMNKRMMSTSLAALDGVDVVAVVTDVTAPFGGGDDFLARLLRSRTTRRYLLVNKIDRVAKPEILPFIERWTKACSFDEVFPISAKTGNGVEGFINTVTGELPPGPELYPPDQVSDVTERFLAAEVVREQILRRTREEIPYSTTVLIEDFDAGDKPDSMLRIEATILVERSSQKAILVGKAGQAIKAIGTSARRELEASLGRKVYIGLRVRAQGAWRNDDRLLDRLGLPG